MVWVKRSVMSFKFKGRPRRGLFWTKSVYKLWFEYAKASPRNIPAEFGNLDDFKNFDEWWKHPDYGFELFCEPPIAEKSVTVVDSIGEPEKDVIYLKVHLNEQPAKLKRLFHTVLKRHQKKKLEEPKSKARFQPSAHQRHIKLGALKKYLETWQKMESGMTRREIFNQRYKNSVAEENQLRVISRECQRVKEIFANIEKGTFP